MSRPSRAPSWFAAVAATLLATTLLASGARAQGGAPSTGGKAGGPMIVYLGTYTGPKSSGIYMAKFDPATGSLGRPEIAGETKNPSFLAIHPSRKTLYSVGEVAEFQGKKSGVVSAFSIDPATGKLTLLNQQPTTGDGPCFVTVDATGKAALIANYGGGSVTCVPIQPDGSLAAPTAFVQHSGSGADKQRQKGPHAHSINVSPDNRFAIAADLGLDQLLVYRFNPTDGTLAPHEPKFATVAPGSGPRHFTFDPAGKFGYVCNEMAMTVTAFSYDAARGALTEIQTIGTLPQGTENSPKFSTAEVQVHPSGRFLYVSNRGHDTIAAFTIDPATGKLTAAGHTPTGGKAPRNFRIDPTGAWLLAANQGSDNVVVFKIDPQTGALSPTGTTVSVGSPVCVKFLQMGE
jgi:6-phosphogluconolactonase